MGGLLYLKKEKNRESACNKAKKVFEEKGLSLEKKITRPGFTVYLYQKLSLKTGNFLEFKNKDFIAAAGTLIYKEKIGSAALKELHEDFSNQEDFFSRLMGHYCVLLYKNGELYIFRDFGGFYTVYTNHEMSVVSNSFPALLSTLEKRDISLQELYEYVFSGFFYTRKTLVKGIHLLDGKKIFKIWPNLSTSVKKIPGEELSPCRDFEDAVEKVSADIIDYFETIKKVSDNDMASALSGGYDTRLMLAALRHVGAAPYLYVYGEKNSPDVTISKHIAAGEKLKLDYKDKSKYPRIAPCKFGDFIKKQFFLLDGLGPAGVFEDGVHLHYRIALSTRTRLHLNGAGGEIYRECWNLPDRDISIKNFFRAKFDLHDYSFCRGEFNKKDYFVRFREKIKELAEVKGNYLTREEIEKLFPFLRNKFAMFLISELNQYAHSLLPFAEPVFIFRAFTIPFSFRNHGRFQAALIKHLDEALARYDSAYGADFMGKPGLKKNIADYAAQNFPFSLRPLLKAVRKKKKQKLPYYLEKDFLKQVFDPGEMAVGRYFDLSRITNPLMLSRVLSVELLLSKKWI